MNGAAPAAQTSQRREAREDGCGPHLDFLNVTGSVLAHACDRTISLAPDAFCAPAVLLGQSAACRRRESVFGFRPGADYKLATYDQSIDYFKKLAAASKYVKLVEAGKTSQGRPMYFALVSSPDNLGKIDRYREIARRLAHPQG